MAKVDPATCEAVVAVINGLVDKQLVHAIPPVGQQKEQSPEWQPGRAQGGL